MLEYRGIFFNCGQLKRNIRSSCDHEFDSHGENALFSLTNLNIHYKYNYKCTKCLIIIKTYTLFVGCKI